MHHRLAFKVISQNLNVFYTISSTNYFSLTNIMYHSRQYLNCITEAGELLQKGSGRGN